MRSKVSEEDRLKAVKRYIAGENVAAIAMEYRVGCSTVASWARTAGKRKRKEFTEKERQQVCEDYGKGMHIHDIEEKYNVSATTIKRWAKERGIRVNRKIQKHLPKFETEEYHIKKKKKVGFIKTGAGAGYWGLMDG